MSTHKMWRLLLLIGAIICSSIPADALMCYSCTYAVGGLDEECVANPEDVPQNPITFCNNQKYCISKRTEFIETKDTVVNIYRGCTNIFRNEVEIDPYFRTHYKTCSSDLCNDGDGRATNKSKEKFA